MLRASCGSPATTCRPRRSSASGKVISAVNDPNDYPGPGTGYRIDEARRARDQDDPRVLDRETVLAQEDGVRDARGEDIEFRAIGPAEAGSDPREVVIGVSPGLRHEALPHARRHSARRGAGSADGRHRERRRHGACRAHPAHGGHLLPRPHRRATLGLRRRHRHPGEGHGGDPPRRPAAAQQSRAVLQGADHHAGSLPRARPNAALHARGEIPEPVVVPTAARRWARAIHARVRCSTRSRRRWSSTARAGGDRSRRRRRRMSDGQARRRRLSARREAARS